MLPETIKFKIAKFAWAVYLWAMNITEAEMLCELYENAVAEYKSDKITRMYQ